MAENITTLLEKPDAENVSGSDYLWLVQGTGSDRDRKISLTALFASDPAQTTGKRASIYNATNCNASCDCFIVSNSARCFSLMRTWW